MLSMSLSLIAVFVPILLMGGIVGRLFREFAMTLSVAILISLVVSLTTTPMMCAYLLHRPARIGSTGRLYRASERVFDGDARTLRPHPAPGIALAGARHAEPVGDPGLRPSISFIDHAEGLLSAAGHRADDRRHPGRPEHLVPVDAAEADPVRRHHSARIRRSQSVSRLHRRRPDQFGLRVRRAEAAGRAPASRSQQVIGRLRPKLNAGRRRPALSAAGDRTSGSAGARATRNTSTPCKATTPTSIYEWAPKLEAALQQAAAADRCQSRPAAKGARDRSGHRPGDRGAARAHRQPDRQHALRRLRPAPGVGDLRRAQPIPCRHGGGARVLAEPGHAEPDLCQHQRRRGQRHAGDQRARRDGARPRCRPRTAPMRRLPPPRSPATRRATWPTTRSPTPAAAPPRPAPRSAPRARTMVPLSAFAHFGPGNTPLAVNHQNLFVASTISFNLAAGRLAQPGDGGDRGRDGAPRRAGLDPRQLSRAPPRSFSNRSPTSRC